MVALTGCTGTPPPPCTPRPIPADAVFVVSHGWHTDLGIPATALRGRMTLFRKVFPGMAVLMVGFGKRTFMMAPVTDLGDLLVGPFPGDGAILIAGLRAAPDSAYDDGRMAVLKLPPGGAERLSDFIWNTFDVHDDRPRRIADGFFPGSIFYATRIGYSGFYTCNSWTEEALHAAGLAAGPDGVIFAGQVMQGATSRAGASCSIPTHR